MRSAPIMLTVAAISRSLPSTAAQQLRWTYARGVSMRERRSDADWRQKTAQGNTCVREEMG